jgi:propanediol dehydratase large subunit
MGPCTGYAMSEKRWNEVKAIENALSAADFE